jgi:DMSO/TMAO reductase YedYZ molybdopterin-dependent catalytic subunit
MKSHMRLILGGLLLVALALGFAACAPQTEPAPTPTSAPVATEVQATEAPAEVVLEIVGAAETKSFTLADLQALPITEGFAGTKSSTGKITPPVTFKGVSLKDLAAAAGGLDADSGFNLVAKDGYGITFSLDQINNGTFTAYDPATGDELKNPVELTAMLAYEMDGQALNVEQDGYLRLVIVSAEPTQVTDGHWSVKWVTTVETKSMVEEWNLQAEGAISETIDRASVESCGAPQCHGTSWTDDKAQEWVGVPLWLLVGAVDDEIAHEGPAFNDALADGGYNVDVIAADGYTVTFAAARVKRNDNILVAFKVNNNPLDEKYFPLRLVGSDLEKSEMAGQIATIKVLIEATAATEPAATEPAATEPAVGPVTEADATLTIEGAVNQPVFLNEAALRALEVVKINAPNAKGVAADFEGVRLSTLLELAGVKDSATTVRFTASDGYYSEIKLADLKACTDCLLGFTNTLEKFKLVMPGMTSDFWVKEVTKITVR